MLTSSLTYHPDQHYITPVYRPDLDQASINLSCAITGEMVMIVSSIRDLPEILDALESAIESLRATHSAHMLNTLDQAIEQSHHDELTDKARRDT